MRKENKKRVALLMLPFLFLLLFVSASYAANLARITATATVVKPSSSIDIKFFLGFFYGQLKDSMTGKGLINKPVKLTVQYYEYSHNNLQLKTATYDLKTGVNGYWSKRFDWDKWFGWDNWFGFKWTYAKIEFAGDSTAGPASAAITASTTTTTTTTTTTIKPRECKEDDYRCDVNKLERCDDGKWILVKSCVYGCSNEKCNPATTTTSTTTTTTIPPKKETTITIKFSEGSFSGYLKDKTTGKGINEPVKLTVKYMQNKASTTEIYNLQTSNDGKWIKSFGLDWKSAKIEFAGDAAYFSSSATINR